MLTKTTATFIESDPKSMAIDDMHTVQMENKPKQIVGKHTCWWQKTTDKKKQSAVYKDQAHFAWKPMGKQTTRVSRKH